MLDGVLLGRVSLENVNWNMGVREMTDSGGLSWEAQEVFQKMKSFNRLPGASIPMIQLNMRVGSASRARPRVTYGRVAFCTSGRTDRRFGRDLRAA